MKLPQSGQAIAKAILVAIIVIMIGAILWYVYRVRQDATQAYEQSSASPPVTMTDQGRTLLAEIKDAGATNTNGWDFRIYSNGSGNVQYAPSKNKTIKTPPAKNLPAGAIDTASLRQALDTTDLSGFKDNCPRSASFGSVETLYYKHKSTSGIDCYITTNPSSSLSVQLQAALGKAGV